jgi:DNA-binding GntR family transcriptional regulator
MGLVQLQPHRGSRAAELTDKEMCDLFLQAGFAETDGAALAAADEENG